MKNTRAFSAASSASNPVRVQQVAPSRHAPIVQRQSQRVRAIELVSCEAQQQLQSCNHIRPQSALLWVHLWFIITSVPRFDALQDFSDPDTQLSVAGVVLGLVLGLGAPAFYISRTERDEERLEELRALNRAQYQETGEYMTDVSVDAVAVVNASCCATAVAPPGPVHWLSRLRPGRQLYCASIHRLLACGAFRMVLPALSHKMLVAAMAVAQARPA